ncbi:hypothetical protein ACOME3_003209 [Neoechinorhynchus agilis]
MLPNEQLSKLCSVSNAALVDHPTAAVIGTQEVYRDPRLERLNSGDNREESESLSGEQMTSSLWQKNTRQSINTLKRKLVNAKLVKKRDARRLIDKSRGHLFQSHYQLEAQIVRTVEAIKGYNNWLKDQTAKNVELFRQECDISTLY